MDIEIKNNIENSIEMNENKQTNFIETNLSKTVNAALDIGIRAICPNVIENEIINIKDTILEYGFRDGIKEIINSTIEMGKIH